MHIRSIHKKLGGCSQVFMTNNVLRCRKLSGLLYFSTSVNTDTGVISWLLWALIWVLTLKYRHVVNPHIKADNDQLTTIWTHLHWHTFGFHAYSRGILVLLSPSLLVAHQLTSPINSCEYWMGNQSAIPPPDQCMRNGSCWQLSSSLICMYVIHVYMDSI